MRVVHYLCDNMTKDGVYADNAATTMLDPDALHIMTSLLQDFANPSQPYSFSRNVKKELTNARIEIADSISASPEEIYFTSGGSESDNWAIEGTYNSNICAPRIVTSAFEHHAVLNTCESVRKKGCQIEYIGPTKEGFITPGLLEDALQKPAYLVSIMYANNEIGTIQPIKELSRLAHCHGALFHTDAVQAVGHVPIDVKELDVDMLSASAHKFNGPKGIGFLYIKKGTRINPLIYGGSQEMGLRAGTENVPAISAMATALKNNCTNIVNNQKCITLLETRLLNQLDKLGIKYLRNGSTPRLPGLINISFEEQSGESILHRLDLRKIYVSTGSACDSKSTQYSHVLKSIGLSDNLAKGTIRISLGKNNTDSDIDHIVKELQKIVANE